MNRRSSSQELQARAAPLGARRRRGEILRRVPPQLGDAIVPLRPAPAGAQGDVGVTVERVRLHVAREAQYALVTTHQGAVLLPPAAPELRPRELRQAVEAEDQLDHGARGAPQIARSRPCQYGSRSLRLYSLPFGSRGMLSTKSIERGAL